MLPLLPTGWRPVVRLARRDVRRHLLRSLLVVLLVAAPVGAAAAVAVQVETLGGPEYAAERRFGAADAVLVARPADAAGLLPAGSRTVRKPGSAGYTTFRGANGAAVSATVRVANVGDPLTRHAVRLVSGRAPARTGEIGLTRGLAARLGLLDGEHLRAGASVRFRTAEWAVAGLTLDPYCRSCDAAVIAPATPDPTGKKRTSYLVDLPPGADERTFAAAARGRGAHVELRSALRADPEGFPRTWLPYRNSGLFVRLVGGIAVAQVVLLAGTALAVGARRQARDLGLVAVQGGRPYALGAVLLVQAALLGVLGVGLGIAAGTGAMVAGSWWQPSNALPPAVHVAPEHLAGIAGVGVLAAVVAGAAAAVAAVRRPPLAALAGRVDRARGAAGTGARTALGVVALAVGAAQAAYGHLRLRGELADELRTSARFDDVRVGPFLTDYTDFEAEPFMSVLAGAGIATAGLVLLAPALIGGLARLGRRLPPAGRLALRDAARHRHRCAPATSAVAVAVAGAVALSVFVAGELRSTELRNSVLLPEGTSLVGANSWWDEPEPGREAAGVRAAVAALPGARPTPLDRTGLGSLWFAMAEATAPGDHSFSLPGHPDHCQLQPKPCRPLAEAPGIGTPELLALVAADRREAARLAAAVAEGKAVVFDPTRLDGQGNVTFFTGLTDDQKPVFERVRGVLGHRKGRFVRLPDAYVGARAAAERGWGTVHQGTLLTHDRPTGEEVAAAAAAVRRAGASLAVGGPDEATIITDRPTLRRTALAAAVLVALLGVAIPVALAGAEGRADAATLAAVGAAPRRRRRIVAGSALTVAGLGTALGLVLGFGIAYAALPGTGYLTLVIPWPDLGLLVGAVLALATIVGRAGAVRSPVLTRRDS